MNNCKKIPDKLYQKIVQSMPIACVDLLVSDKLDRVLMLKRKKPPAKGRWWFPGGRVLYRELRIDAARRKLKEECGLEANNIRELGTYDVIFEAIPLNCASHGITTVFRMIVNQNDVRLDKQSTNYAWESVDNWLKQVNHEFLLSVLGLYKIELQSEKLR